MTEKWRIEDAARWEIAGEEPQGRHRHLWLRHHDKERTWLFKRTDVQADRPLHEDIAEKLASELAVRLGIPAARVDLAKLGEDRGCLVEDLRWSGGEDQPGQVLLGGLIADYNPSDRERRGHNVDNIRRALRDFGVPPNSPTPTGFTGFDVMTGYLVFDALIANSDRHDRNWAVLIPPPGHPGPDVLCGSYDHASSFGFNLSDDQRRQRLADGTVAKWCGRGTARQFEHHKGQPRQSLVQLARSASMLCSSTVRGHWLDVMMSVSTDLMDELLSATPELSPTTRTFTRELVMVNRGRLLDALR